jgi:hypothetical protein
MKRTETDPDALDEYDFSGGVRGKHAERYAEGTNIVLLDPDVASYFHDQSTVNEALRNLIKTFQALPGAELKIKKSKGIKEEKARKKSVNAV